MEAAVCSGVTEEASGVGPCKRARREVKDGDRGPVGVEERQRPAAILPAYVSIRQHTSAYVSIRQHTPAYVRVVGFEERDRTTARCKQKGVRDKAQGVSRKV